MRENAEDQTLPSPGRGRFLICRDISHPSIKCYCPVDRGRIVRSGQRAGVRTRTQDAVVTPQIFRLAFQKIDRLHLPG